jgi:hypothetical protein
VTNCLAYGGNDSAGGEVCDGGVEEEGRYTYQSIVTFTKQIKWGLEEGAAMGPIITSTIYQTKEEQLRRRGRHLSIDDQDSCLEN